MLNAGVTNDLYHKMKEKNKESLAYDFGIKITYSVLVIKHQTEWLLSYLVCLVQERRILLNT
ncbi:MAG: hypothetical protein JWO58_1611 [Chitinophagaceae bacterium]|nr:hypothetical protein [Chitinophagaceae bacterium]